VNRTSIIIIIFAVIVVAAGIVGFRLTNQDSTNIITVGSRQIINNTWGAPPEEKLTTGIYLNQDKTFGWYWDRPDPMTKPEITGLQPLYPNVKVGGDIGGKSTTRSLPIKAEAIKQLQFSIDYLYVTPPTGLYNLAYQMYFANPKTAPGSQQGIVEVMIWIHYTFGQPPSAYKGIFSDGVNSYDLYSFSRIDEQYMAFMMKGQPGFKAQHLVDAKELLTYAAIDPNWYLYSIHLGNEILKGSGKLIINRLEINLNGKNL
jgi:hypothetical protein